MKGFKAVACSAALVAALAVAGCGSSDDDSSSDDTSTDITKAQFVEQANAICAGSNKAIDTAAKKVFGNGQPTQAEFESFINSTALPQVETQITAIHELGIPAGEEDQVNEILDSADSALADAKSDPTTMADQANDPFADANKLAAAYGLNECAG